MGDFFFIIGIVVFMFVFMFVVLGLFSKVTNTRVTHLGKPVMNPNDLEDAIKGIAKGSVNIAKGAKNATSKIISKMQYKNELEKLKTLADLKEKGVITEEEFERLKRDILK